jgi:hypothetical protein
MPTPIRDRTPTATRRTAALGDPRQPVDRDQASWHHAWMEVHLNPFSTLLARERINPAPRKVENQHIPKDGWSSSATHEPAALDLRALRQTVSQQKPEDALEPFQPILNTVKISPEKKATPVPTEVLERAQKYLDRGDRGAAYLTLYQELGNEQILIQTGITTYTGFWGSGALTGNSLAQRDGGERYQTPLDDFSVEIAQATIDAVRKDLENGGTGRLSDDQFQSADRQVWKDKGMPELFPGNVQFMDFWNHEEEHSGAFFSRGTVNMIGAGMRSMVPNTSLFGLNQDGRNLNSLVGKRPAEFEGDPDYTIHGGEKDRFLTVVDNRTGFIEAFWDKRPRITGGLIPLRQLPNKPLDKNSPEYQQRKKLYEQLGANRHRPA